MVLDVKPLPRGSGFQFEESITGGVVPRNYIPSVEEGVIDGLKHGPLGFPVVDIAVTLIDGSYHTVDSSDQAFRTAGRIGVVEALPQCHPVLLEPIHLVEIAVRTMRRRRSTPSCRGVAGRFSVSTPATAGPAGIASRR